MTSSLINKMAECIKYAINAKSVDYVDVVCEKYNSATVSYAGGKFENIDNKELEHFGIRVIHKKRQAVISRSNIEDYKNDLDILLNIISNLPEDNFVGFPAGDVIVKNGLFNCSKIAKPKTETLLSIAELIASGAKDAGECVQIDKASACYTGKSRVTMASNGFLGEHTSAYLSCSAEATARSGEYMECGDSYKIFCRDPKNYESIGFKAAKKACAKLGSKKIPSSNMTVIIDRLPAGEFVSCMLGALNGSLIASGGSMFCGMLNENCFNSSVVLLDDPTIDCGINSESFDAEGCAVSPLYLVRNGHIRNFLLDHYNAQKLNLPNNFRAGRSVVSSPVPSNTNVVLKATNKVVADAISSIDNGLYITDFIGMGVNLLTGNFSKGCNGIMIEHGKLTYPVSEVTMSCNLNDVFKRILPLDDLEVEFGVDSPSIYVENVTIGGI